MVSEQEAEQRKKQEAARKRIEQSSLKNQMTFTPDQASNQQWELPTHDTDAPMHRTFAAIGTRTVPARSEFDLEQQEQEIIENLEREELDRLGREDDEMKPWQSAETVKRSEMAEMEERVTRDVESVLLNQKPSDMTVRPSRSFFDFDEDQRKMEEWDAEQEKRRQVWCSVYPPGGTDVVYAH